MMKDLLVSIDYIYIDIETTRTYPNTWKSIRDNAFILKFYIYTILSKI